MNSLAYWLALFSCLAICLQSVMVLNKVNCRTHDGVRLAFLGLALSGCWAVLESLGARTIPVESLIGVAVAISVLLAVDRRGRK